VHQNKPMVKEDLTPFESLAQSHFEYCDFTKVFQVIKAIKDGKFAKIVENV
jgi:hypothetical protein